MDYDFGDNFLQNSLGKFCFYLLNLNSLMPIDSLVKLS